MTAAVRSSITLFVVVVGCAAPGDAPHVDTTTAEINTFVPQQGRLVMGFKDSDVRTFTLPSPTPITVDRFGRLSNGTLTGTAFRGYKFSSTGNGITYGMRISNVIPPTAPDTQWQYVLDQIDPATGTLTAACDAPPPLVPTQDPPESPVRAYAMAGNWTAAGGFIPSNVVAFACKTGVVGKCVMWGYGPDRTWPATTLHGVASNASANDMLQTCTRMARADYCGNGLPNTIDGTPIHIDTAFAPLVPDPDFPFEAAWTGEAAVRGRLVPQPVVCLSKLRWATLPIGGDCPLAIPDPRKDTKGKFCEDLPALELEQRHSYLYSSSTFIDAGLNTYRDPSTGERLTTASLVPGKVNTLPTWIIPPPAAGAPFPVNSDLPTFEATLFNSRLPVAIPDEHLVPLTSYRCANDLVTTTSAMDPGTCKEIALEGWVYPPNTPNRAPLRRWFDRATKRNWTTARAASTMLAEHWLPQEVVGGVLRAAIDVNVRWGSMGAGYTYQLDVQTRTGEWLLNCPAALLTTTATKFTGQCFTPTARDLNHADILAFRVTATLAGQPPVVSRPQLYDGYSSDVYVALPGSTTRALALHWNEFAPGISYRIWFDTGAGYQRCEDTQQLANDTSHVHTGQCFIDNHDAKIPEIKSIMVCAAQPEGAEQGCGEALYNGVDPDVTILVK